MSLSFSNMQVAQGRFYDSKLLFKLLLAFVGMVLTLKFTSGAGIAILIPFIIVALSTRNVEKSFFMVLLLISMTMGNGNLMPKGAVFYIVTRLTLIFLAFVLSMGTFGRKNSRFLTPLLMLMLYLCSVSISSIVGWCPFVSFLKLFLFTAIFFAFYSVTNQMIMSRQFHAVRIRTIMLSVAVFFLIGSVALIPTGLGVMTRTSGMEITVFDSLYMGMTQHSQSLGPIVAALGTIVLADYIFCVQKSDKLYLLLLLCVPVLVWKTSSRTAMGTLIAGWGVVFFFFMGARGVTSRWRGKVMSVALVLIAIGGGVLLASGKAQQQIKNFVLKSQDTEGRVVDFESVASSRQGLVETAMRNFHNSPMIGNGFQVAEHMAGYSFQDVRLVLSAPIEKGVWVAAVLEEAGAVGMGVFVVFVITALRLFASRRCYIGASMLVVLLVSNFGEFTMFSMSYTGGMMWALLFVGLAMDAAREKSHVMENWR